MNVDAERLFTVDAALLVVGRFLLRLGRLAAFAADAAGSRRHVVMISEELRGDEEMSMEEEKNVNCYLNDDCRLFIAVEMCDDEDDGRVLDTRSRRTCAHLVCVCV